MSVHRRIRPVVAAMVLSATLAVGLAVGLATAPTVDAAPPKRMTTTEASYAASVVRLINKQRASRNVRPLKVNPALTRAGLLHNIAMSTVNIISHLLPGEPAFNVRQWQAGYHYKCWAGENIGVHGNMNRRAALELQQGMFNERPPENGHRLNILNKHYTEVGVAVGLDDKNHRLWLTVEFGSRC